MVAGALSRRSIASSRLVFTTDDSRSSDEGLAALESYLAVADRQVRQAFLDLLLTIVEIDPHD